VKKSMYSELGKRDYQQDRVASVEIDGVSVLGVCDGNGGLGGGEVAEIALKTALSELAWQMSQDKRKTPEILEQFALWAIKASSDEVNRAKKLHATWSGAGTTITLVLVSSNSIVSAWVGDSPAYMLNYDTGLNRLVVPHNLLEEYIKDGWSRQSLKGQDSLGSTLTRCLGHPCCEAESLIVPYKLTTKVVIGSDGVLDYLSEEEIISVFDSLTVLSWQDASKRFVKEALHNFSDDNVSAITALCFPDKKKKMVRKTRVYGE